MIKYNYFIDIIKFLSVFPILIRHMFYDFITKTQKGNESILNIANHLGNGAFCVDIFFVISGFLLFESYKKNTDLSVFDFVKKRLLRLAPLYILSLTFVYIFNLNYFDTKFIHFNDYIYQIFFAQSTGLNVPGDMFNPYAWYVCVLFWCSVFLYLLFRAFDRKKLELFLFIMAFVFYTIISQHNIVSAHREIYYSLINGGILRALAGMSIGVIISNCNLKKENNSNLFSFVFFSLCEIILFVVLYSKIFYYHQENYMLLLINFVVLFILLIKQKGILSCLFNKLKFKDKYGYSIYLFQWGIYLFLNKMGYFSSVFFTDNLFLGVFLAVVICCFCGIIAVKFINILLKYLQKLYVLLCGGVGIFR